MEKDQATLLIVEDDGLVASAIAREARPLLLTHRCASAREARVLFDEPQLGTMTAAVIDVGLPDGDGLDVAEALRAKRPMMPILVLTASNDPATINRAHALRAEFVCKPFFRDNLRSFLKRLAATPDANARLASAVERAAREHSLTTRETQILALALDGVPRANLAEVLGVSENTVKTQIRSLLDKTFCEGLAQLVWSVRSSIEPRA